MRNWWNRQLAVIKQWLGMEVPQLTTEPTPQPCNDNMANRKLVHHEMAMASTPPVVTTFHKREPDSPAEQAYNALLTDASKQEEAVLLTQEGYPSAFQTPELPLLARGGSLTLIGANLAFLFVDNPADNADPERMTLNIKRLKQFIRRAYENDTKVTLLMDADIMDQPERVAEKYQSLRGEPKAKTRYAMVLKEAKLIGKLIKSGQLQQIVSQVIQEKNVNSGLSERVREELSDRAASRFLQQNFLLEGIKTDKPLEVAAWEVDGPKGKLMGSRANQPGQKGDCRWMVGAEPALHRLQSQGGEKGKNATMLLQAVGQMHEFASHSQTLQHPVHMPKQDQMIQR